MLDAVTELIVGPPQLWHIPLEPFPPTPTVVGSPGQVTETVVLYFPEEYDQPSQIAFDKAVRQLGKILQGTAKGFKSFTAGWAVENCDNPGTSTKSKAYILLTGWESRKAALDFRSTQSFVDNFKLLLGARDLQEYEVFHVSATELEKE